jgi:hypothetical protein
VVRHEVGGFVHHESTMLSSPSSSHDLDLSRWSTTEVHQIPQERRRDVGCRGRRWTREHRGRDFLLPSDRGRCESEDARMDRLDATVPDAPTELMAGQTVRLPRRSREDTVVPRGLSPE